VLFRDPDPGDRVWQIGLHRTFTVPGPNTAFGDLEECQFNGYSRRTIVRGNWQDPVVLGFTPTIVYGQQRQEWQVGGDGAVVWGWFLLNQITENLLLVQVTDEAIHADPLQRVYLWPRIQLSTLLVCP
jgi:hypothetical protein